MAEERWERLAAGTGIVFVVLGVVAYLIAGQPPTPDDPASEVVAYHTENRDSLLLSNYLWGIAGIFYFWFLGSLRSYLRQAEGDAGRLSAVAFGAGIAGGVVFTFGVIVSAAVASRVAATASQEVTVALHDVATQAFNFATFAFVVLAAATTVVSGRYKALPAGIGWLGWLVVLLTLLGSVAVLVESGPLAAGGAVSYVGFALFFLWFLALSVSLTQRAGRPPT
jgi:hypothetical protein